MKRYSRVIVKKTQSNPERCCITPLQCLLLKTRQRHKIENNELGKICGPHALIVEVKSCLSNIESSTKF